MKKIIIFTIICILILSFATASINQSEEEEKTKPTYINTLEVNELTKENKTKLIGFYSRTFSEIKQVNNYKQHNNITILNVTLGKKKYARLLTNTDKFNNILR